MSEGQIADLVLASASPRRRELLEQLGLALSVRPPTSTRRPGPGERPADYVRRIAAAKCDARRGGARRPAGDAAGLPLPTADAGARTRW